MLLLTSCRPWTWSPSSRRAWIEIALKRKPARSVQVALLAEGVDRNFLFRGQVGQQVKSPSSRRAWIEMSSGL